MPFLLSVPRDNLGDVVFLSQGYQAHRMLHPNRELQHWAIPLTCTPDSTTPGGGRDSSHHYQISLL
jgi:hypothetical protein